MGRWALSSLLVDSRVDDVRCSLGAGNGIDTETVPAAEAGVRNSALMRRSADGANTTAAKEYGAFGHSSVHRGQTRSRPSS